MTDQHPLAIELLAAASYAPGTENVHEHIRNCTTCQAEFDFLTEAIDEDDIDDAAALRNILQGAPTLPNALTDDDGLAGHSEPVVGELWRIGDRRQALLVVVASVLGDLARVVPMVLDLAVADDSSSYVQADRSPLGVDSILLNDLARTVPLSAFLTRVGTLYSRDESEEDSVRLDGVALIGNHIAFPIDHPHDMRIERRLEIEELLDDLNGSMPVDHWNYPYSFESLREDLRTRIFGSDLYPLPKVTFDIGQSFELACVGKITHLQTSTVLATLIGLDPRTVMTAGALAGPCLELLRHEPDANAVAVVVPVGDWTTALFTSADANEAVSAPTGARVGATATLIGHGLLDTMHKYLDGRVTAWEETDGTRTRLNTSDIGDVVRRNSQASVEAIRKTGSRSREPKKAVWSSLSSSVDESVALFVQALLNDTPVSEALDSLDPEDNR